MRHGEAGEAMRDAERPLTARGRAQAESSARALLALGAAPPVLWHSPYRRAVETAQIVAGVFGLTSAMIEDERFTPDANVAAAAMAVLQARRGVIVIAHMPILPGIVSLLCGSPCNFTTAGVAHLDVAGGGANLIGLYPARTLEHLR